MADRCNDGQRHAFVWLRRDEQYVTVRLPERANAVDGRVFEDVFFCPGCLTVRRIESATWEAYQRAQTYAASFGKQGQS